MCFLSTFLSAVRWTPSSMWTGLVSRCGWCGDCGFQDGLSSRFKPFSWLCTSFLQSTFLAPTKEQDRAHTPRYRSLQGRHHPHTATCPIPSDHQAGQAEQHPKILTQRHFDSEGREGAQSPLWSRAAETACVIFPSGSRLPYSLPTSWQRGQCLEKASQQLQD